MSGEPKPVTAELFVGFEDDKPQDECGVFGIYAPGEPVCTITYEALQELQDRGTSGAGLAYYDPEFCCLTVHKGFDEVPKAIGKELRPDSDGQSAIDAIRPPLAIGHVRYSTDEGEHEGALHPHIGGRSSMALAHNGHIEAMDELAVSFGVEARPGDTDSYLLTQVIDRVAAERCCDLETALGYVLPEVNGAYCLTIADKSRVIGVRDPWGTHPLSLGELPGGKGFVLASEEVAFSVAGASFVRDIEPGEIITLSDTGIESRFIERMEPTRHCMYEFLYIARPDGKIDGASVYLARELMGKYLAEDQPAPADVVVGVPDSGLSAAAGFAEGSGLSKVEGIFKNRHVGRTFIQRGSKRQGSLEKKFRPNAVKLDGQSVALVDDSLIKGSTMRVLIGLLREAGAAEVHVRLAAPQYRYPCYSGMDTRDVWRLIAHENDDDEIAALIGADTVAFNSIARVEQAVREAGLQRRQGLGSFCTACATGNYPFKVPALSELPLPRLRSAER